VRWRRRRKAHELLVAAPVGEALEVPADRRAHVIEVALLAHGRSILAVPTTPSDVLQRGEANVTVQTTASPSPKRPDARAGAAPASRKLGSRTFARCDGD
jgi:hypothetical protein